jgi:hypothetical protein
MTMPHINIDEQFTYHNPTEAQIVSLKAIREKAKELAYLIQENTPPCPDQTAAIRKLRECVMTANAAVVLEGR